MEMEEEIDDAVEEKEKGYVDNGRDCIDQFSHPPAFDTAEPEMATLGALLVIG